jgi:hypothetical protein
MLDSLSLSELNYWIAYFTVEPFPDERMELRNALLISTLANMWKSEKVKPFGLDTFMLDFWKEATPDETKKTNSDKMAKQVLQLNAIFGGADKRLQ